MKSAITISLLPSRPNMPFVLGPDLKSSFRMANELKFDAVEIFPPDLNSLDAAGLADLVSEFECPVSTIGTGGGAVSQGLYLTDANEANRQEAIQYVRGVIERAAQLDAMAIIGSMQGRTHGRDRSEVLELLGLALRELGDYAASLGQTLLLEPLNRYESDLLNSLQEAANLVGQAECSNVRILADLFHMNIEERCVEESIELHGPLIGHVHFVDSNRWPAGMGHSDLTAAARSLQKIQYDGYLAIEAFPLPDQEQAARQAANWFHASGILTARAQESA